jgi:glucose-1-phosphate thymidylyltransferase
MKGIITAGGRGTRMRPVTFSTNKHFIPIANNPLLHYAIEEMVNAGINEIGINYNPGQLKELKEHLGSGKDWGVEFTYILQEEPKGLAHIVKVSRDFIGKDKFVMHLGDNIFYGGISNLIKQFEKSKSNALLTTIHHPQNFRMGVPYFNKKNELEKVVEKPKDPPDDLAVPGLYFLMRMLLKLLKEKTKLHLQPEESWKLVQFTIGY